MGSDWSVMVQKVLLIAVTIKLKVLHVEALVSTKVPRQNELNVSPEQKEGKCG